MVKRQCRNALCRNRSDPPRSHLVLTWTSSLLLRHRYTVYKDHITLEDYEVHDGMGLELYYN